MSFTEQLPTTSFDVSGLSYSQRLAAAALQGLVNRNGPLLFLNYGIYDDPLARRTNEVFLDDALWYGKYRDLLGNQDQRNLDYYCQEHGFKPRPVENLGELITLYRDKLRGCVIWDESEPDTGNIALMLAAQEDLLPVEAGMDSVVARFDLSVRHDLRGQWSDRLALYTWAFEHLFQASEPGFIACLEPGWQRPEFVDYLVQHKIFIYNLSSRSQGLGDTLLLLLAFGPAWLRHTLFALRLDGSLRWLGLGLMGIRSQEVKLATRLQRAVRSNSYPTIFGWHTQRDDELSFMLHLSANGMRLVPAHLAGNFSFHSQVIPLGKTAPVQTVEDPPLDPEGIYLTFTLSDGDQLMMMSTGELGNWYSSKRGSLPFNWETQPLLTELAPALFEKFSRSATSNDCLVAGPSGAGYVIPPLAPDLSTYLKESQRVCLQTGISAITFYVPDPPARVLEQMGRYSKGLAGFLGGYAVQEQTPQVQLGGGMFVSNQWPTIAHLWDQAEDLLEGVRCLVTAPGPKPRFIGVHLFAYRTTLEDVCRFVGSLNESHVHVVRADTFLRLALLSQTRTPAGDLPRE